MMKMFFAQQQRVISSLLTLALFTVVVGCGGEKKETPPAKPETKTEKKEDAAPETKDKAKEEAKSETKEETTKTEPAPAPVAKTEMKPTETASNVAPDVAIKAVLDGVAKNPASMINALPASYQKDVNDVVHLFSENMDADLWKAGFGTVKKLGTVLKAKKELLLDPAKLGPTGMSPEQAGEAFDHVVGLLEVLSSSDLADLEKMKKADVQQLITATASKLQPHTDYLAKIGFEKAGQDNKLAKLAETTVTLISNEGGVAKLKIEAPGEEPEEEEFVQVEGKWIPKKMNPEEWKKQMDEAKAGLAQLAPMLEQNKPMALGVIGMVDGVLGKIEKAETKEELEKELQSAMAPLMPLIMQQMMKGGSITPPSAPPKPVEKKE